MKPTTPCKIIRYDEWARQALADAETNEKGNFGNVMTVMPNPHDPEKPIRKSYPCFETDIAYALEFRAHLKEARKPLVFKVVVERQNEPTWRIITDDEWVPALERRRSRDRERKKLIPEQKPKRARITRATDLRR